MSEILVPPVPVPATATNIEDELRTSYLAYSMSVIVGRAIPDVRDGLKPVHRRILYTMHELNNHHTAAYKKSARVVGDVMGKYHPHGDAAIYDALARMAQDFNMRYCLVDGQGNFGSVDGDPPAAMRYTEVRLDRFAQELLTDINKETVDFGPNYDDSLEEPLVLPSKVPNLLLNGSEGIAVGMATKIPPHNLYELIDGTIAMIRKPEVTNAELLQHIQGPDFPTGGLILGMEGIHSAYTTGRGIVRVRAKVDIEVHPKTDRETIVVTEIPYQVNKARLIEKIAELVKEKKVEGISDIRDESDRTGMRVVIELKRDAVSQVILNQLYKLTPLQSSFGIILLAIVDGRPEILKLRDILSRFIEHRREIVTRRSVFDLKKADERFHVLLGLLVAVDHIDRVIQIIRASNDPDIAKQSLVLEEFKGNLPQFPGIETPQLQEAHKVGYFKLSEAQAKAILDLRLHRLTGLEREKLLSEAGDVKTAIQRLREILSNEKVLMGVIEGELLEIKEKYCKDGPDRKTELVPDEGEIALEDLIAKEDVVVTVSHTGYIKRSSLSMYRAQKRGGKGKTGMATKEDDFVTDLFVSSTHDTMLAFTNKGRVFSKKVYEIPAANPNARGKAIVNFVQLEKDEKVAAFIPVSEFSTEGTGIVFATRNGVVKKTVLSLFANIRQNGIIALLIDDDDQLIAARVVQAKQEMFLGTKDGYSIRFSEEELRPIGRQARGVRGITLREGDHVVGMEVLSENNETILTVCENGFGKRTEVSEYRDQHRGGSGILTIKASERNGPVMGFARVADEDQIMVVTNKGSLIRTPTKGISVLGRNTQGVRIINIDEEGEKVVALARLPREETSEDPTLNPQVAIPGTSAAPAPSHGTNGNGTHGTNGTASNGAPKPDLDLN